MDKDVTMPIMVLILINVVLVGICSVFCLGVYSLLRRINRIAGAIEKQYELSSYNESDSDYQYPDLNRMGKNNQDTMWED